ncbi:hypothetical protein COO60DRAFT_1528765 [Scenedesmus sp. NREL 46B-D3]|nr:hypothetical protein COO60DRAFT_1528765 [Scenedesmus sp. NREL 46B-D3]
MVLVDQTAQLRTASQSLMLDHMSVALGTLLLTYFLLCAYMHGTNIWGELVCYSGIGVSGFAHCPVLVYMCVWVAVPKGCVHSAGQVALLRGSTIGLPAKAS